MVTIVDYELGNLGSLRKALETVGIEYIISGKKEDVENSDAIILPGVGAFRDAIEFIEKNNLKESIKRHVDDGKFLIGICLGMQLFYDKSYENGCYEGLGLLEGDVVKLKSKKVPHMGWNNLNIKKEEPITKGLSDEDYVYFVHSYYAVGDEKDTLAFSEYELTVPAIVRKGNIIGFQFHPEKSGEIGEKILKNLREVIK
jgi:glutamine amidotransferase